MACNSCETLFEGLQTVVVSVVKSGTNALIYVQNKGRNIVLIRRIVLCTALPGGGIQSTYYLRPSPDALSWSAPSPFLEPNLQWLFFTLSNVPAGHIVQAQAEYVELDGRSRSCPTTM
jgi:hypothetical protein